MSTFSSCRLWGYNGTLHIAHPVAKTPLVSLESPHLNFAVSNEEEGRHFD